MRHIQRIGIAGATLAWLTAVAIAQQPAGEASRSFPASAYARAEKFLTYNASPLVLRSGVRATWLPDDRFWYRITTEKGAETVLVDPVRGSRAACDLPACKAAEREGNRGGAGGGRGGAGARTDVVSPDGKRAAFIREDNLWVRDVASAKETKLTTDGVKDFGYATDNAGWTKSERPILIWSPDSKRIATYQQDQRGVGEMYLVETKVGHPRLQAWKYPLPGDEVITMIQRVVIDVEAPRVDRKSVV